jgi:hypothetical protein
MTKQSAKWSCHVETLSFRGPASVRVRTVFAVEQQSFILAEGNGKNPDDVQHCRFMCDMFTKALGRIGAPLPTLPVTMGAKVIPLAGRKKRKSSPRAMPRTQALAPMVCEHGTTGCDGRGEKHWCAK